MDVLIVGDTRSSDLRHEIPLGVADVIAYAERDGERYAFAGFLETDRLEALGGLTVMSLESLGMDKALGEGKSTLAATQEAVAEGCRRIGISDAVTPSDFPLGVAEFLKGEGIALHADRRFFEDRRRSKSAAELAGLRRGVEAAEAAFAAMRERIRAAEPTDTDELRAITRHAFAERRAIKHEMRTIVACGPQSADPHAEGEGPIEPGQPIVLDIFPRDLASGCWGDMTRTLCKGEPPERLRRYHAEVREAQRLATEAVRPGATGEELFRIAASYLASKGHDTRMGKTPEQMPSEGFVHGLGHGVGLDVHEPPGLDEGATKPLVVGDVVTIEPGLYYRDFGGVRIEDMVLVTEDGYEVLNKASYDLEA
jgi:Xaa-Pro aminopeptidase